MPFASPLSSIPARWLRRAGAGLAAIGIAASATAWAPAAGPRQDRPLAAAGSPRIAVMVHGFQGLVPWSRGYRCADGLVGLDEPAPPDGRSPRSAGELARLAARLERAGYDVYFARWTTGGAQTIALEDAAGCLAAQVAEARRRTSTRTGQPAPPVTLVGHSMGGLVGRAYVEGAGFAARADVSDLVTFGSPHLGVAADVLLRLLALLNPSALVRGGLPCTTSPGTCELSYEAMAAFNRAHARARGVAYNVVAGDKSIIPASWFVPGADDGVVETRSAAGLDVPRWQVNDAHAAVTSLVADHYAVSDDSARCLEIALALGASARGTCQRIGRPVGAYAGRGAGDGDGTAAGSEADAAIDTVAGAGVDVRAEAALGAAARHAPDAAGGDGIDVLAPAVPGGSTGSTDVPMSPVTALRLGPGEVRSVPLVVDGRAADVAVGWSGGAVAVSLHLPDGRAVDGPTAGAVLPGSRHRALVGRGDAGAEVFGLAAPPAGTWLAVVRNTGAADADVGMFATLASPIRLDAEARPARAAGWAVLVARVTDAGVGIDGAQVEATVVDDGEPVAVPLRPMGDGVYGAPLQIAGTGWRHVAVRAAGMTTGGVVFAREAAAMAGGGR